MAFVLCIQMYQITRTPYYLLHLFLQPEDLDFWLNGDARKSKETDTPPAPRSPAKHVSIQGDGDREDDEEEEAAREDGVSATLGNSRLGGGLTNGVWALFERQELTPDICK